MKSYLQYLQESKQTWKFKIKSVKQLSNDDADRIEKHLMKYHCKFRFSQSWELI